MEVVTSIAYCRAKKRGRCYQRAMVNVYTSYPLLQLYTRTDAHKTYTRATQTTHAHAHAHARAHTPTHASTPTRTPTHPHARRVVECDPNHPVFLSFRLGRLGNIPSSIDGPHAIPGCRLSPEHLCCCGRCHRGCAAGDGDASETILGEGAYGSLCDAGSLEIFQLVYMNEDLFHGCTLTTVISNF